jgi:predicted nuclease with TOPRIM domain
MMVRNQTVEELFQELEGRLKSINGQLEQMRQENARLQERIRQLDQNQSAAVAKINQMLDRMGALG